MFLPQGSNPCLQLSRQLLHHSATSAAAAKSLQLCPTLCDPIDCSPPGSPVPGILQARTQVGCHFLLQCMKVKSESEVASSRLTLRDPMDCSLPGSSIHGIFQARVLEWGAIALSAQPLQRPLKNWQLFPNVFTLKHTSLNLSLKLLYRN